MNRNWMAAGMLSLVAASAGVVAAETPKPTEPPKPTETQKAEGKDDKVAVADIPKVVVDAIAAAQAGGKITEAEKETKNGVVIYEVEVANNGKKYEVKVDATGKLLSNKIDDDDDENDNEVEKKK